MNETFAVNRVLFGIQQSKLECIINNCYFESGAWTEADEYFSELWDEQSKKSLDILSAIVKAHSNDEHMLEGALHILSSLPYSEICPMGLSIGITCSFSHSPLVIDRLITCLEDWNDPATIGILEGMDLSSMPWLSHYRNDVIERLINERCATMGYINRPSGIYQEAPL